MSDKPNILLLMADQFRGDCLGIGGHPDVKTPYLDTLALDGVRFDNAYSSSPTCIAARAALFTGLGQKNHGRVGYKDFVPWRYPVTLAGELTQAGYHTQAVGKMHVYPTRNLCGFHSVDLHDGCIHTSRKGSIPYNEHQDVTDDYRYWLKNEKGISADVTDTGLECNSWVARPWIYDEMAHPTNWVVSRSIDFLRRRDRDKPFFLFSSFVRPHPPIDAPQCYFDMYNRMDLTPPPVGDWADEETYKIHGRRYNSFVAPPDAELQRQSQVGYYACVTHMDHQIGRLLQAMQDHEVLDNTLIIFVSDHGEMLGDHRFVRKSLPYRGSAHIPLIIRPPRGWEGKRRTICNSVAELRDIMPTLIDAAGEKIPEGLDGVSLFDAIKGSETRPMLHGEHEYGHRSNHFVVAQADKYIWFSQDGREQYFDLANDPTECKNLIDAPEHQARIDEMRQFLIAELTGRPEGYADGGQLNAGKETRAML